MTFNIMAERSYAEGRLCWLSLVLSDTHKEPFMLSVIMVSVIMLSVIMLSVIMLSVNYKSFTLIVIYAKCYI
jgi:hypothetical protein